MEEINNGVPTVRALKTKQCKSTKEKKMKKIFVLLMLCMLVGVLFTGCDDETPTESQQIEPVVGESYTENDGATVIQVGEDQVEVQTIDANTGEAIEGVFLRAINVDGTISLLAYDFEGRYLPQLSGGIANDSRGIISIILQLIECNAMYYNEVISSFMTENYAEAIELLLLGGEIEHEEEVTLGYLGESFAQWGVEWAADEILTLFLSLPTGGALAVVSWTVTVGTLIETAYIESIRAHYYALGYSHDDIFIQTSTVNAGSFGGAACVQRFFSLEPKNEPSSEPQQTGNITMSIKNATNGYGVTGARISINPGTGSPDYFYSNSSGNVNATNIIPGEHIITVEHDDYQSRFINNVIVNSNQTTNSGDITINPLGYSGSDRVRFVLTWGQNPSDLDIHLWYVDGTNDEHFYYGHQGNEDIFPYVELDVDDVSSYGPETMTVSQLTPNSTYIVAVHEYSSSSYLPTSGAAIDVFSDTQGQISHCPVPSGSVGNRWWWYVLSMDGYGNITYDDSFHSGSPRGNKTEYDMKN